jgi:outer membrane protein OmpA-like peptidoglycan-associated protein
MTPRRGLEPGTSGHHAAAGLVDLMTSLAVIFVLLMVVFASAPRPPEAPAPSPPAPAAPRTVLAPEALAALTRLGLVPQPDAAEPDALRLLVPERLLNFEFGRSALTASAEQFLRAVMPVYARTVCGALRDRVAGVVIEGHTDDLGGDAMNLRLSQERSFRVLVRGLEVLRASAPADHDCFAALASASGRGRQDLIYDAARHPDRESSRRVVFKLLFRTAPAG